MRHSRVSWVQSQDPLISCGCQVTNNNQSYHSRIMTGTTRIASGGTPSLVKGNSFRGLLLCLRWPQTAAFLVSYRTNTGCRTCALWRCHPRLWFSPWFLHVGHDDDTVNKCTTEPQTARYVWASVWRPPLSSLCCFVKHTSCRLQFLPEVAFFLLWDKTETNLCCAGKAAAVWEVRGGMAFAVFSTSAATLMKRNHLTCLIGGKTGWTRSLEIGEKNLIKL